MYPTVPDKQFPEIHSCANSLPLCPSFMRFTVTRCDGTDSDGFYKGLDMLMAEMKMAD